MKDVILTKSDFLHWANYKGEKIYTNKERTYSILESQLNTAIIFSNKRNKYPDFKINSLLHQKSEKLTIQPIYTKDEPIDFSATKNLTQLIIIELRMY